MKNNKNVPFSGKYLKGLIVLCMASSLLATPVLAAKQQPFEKVLSTYAVQELLKDRELKNLMNKYDMIKILQEDIKEHTEKGEKIEKNKEDPNYKNKAYQNSDTLKYKKEQLDLYTGYLENAKNDLLPEMREMLEPVFLEYESTLGLTGKNRIGTKNAPKLEEALRKYALYKLKKEPLMISIKTIYTKIENYRNDIERSTKELAAIKNNTSKNKYTDKKAGIRFHEEQIKDLKIYLEKALRILEERKSNLTPELHNTFQDAFRAYEKQAKFDSIKRIDIPVTPSAPKAPNSTRSSNQTSTPDPLPSSSKTSTPDPLPSSSQTSTPDPLPSSSQTSTPDSTRSSSQTSIPDPLPSFGQTSTPNSTRSSSQTSTPTVENISKEYEKINSILDQFNSDFKNGHKKIEEIFDRTIEADKKAFSRMADIIESKQRIVAWESRLSADQYKRLADLKRSGQVKLNADKETIQEMQSLVESKNAVNPADTGSWWKRIQQQIKNILEKIRAFFRNDNSQKTDAKQEPKQGTSLSHLQEKNKPVTDKNQNKDSKVKQAQATAEQKSKLKNIQEKISQTLNKKVK